MPYVAERADRVVDFFHELLRHTSGEWAGQPFHLHDWQENDLIRPLFGTVEAPEGFPYTDAEWLALSPEDREPWLPALMAQPRQYRRAFIEVPRKNGKSELAAGVALYLLLADREPGAQIYGAARDREQAEIVYNVARDMVLYNPKLQRVARVIDSRKRVLAPKTNSYYRAIPADAAGAHGYNAHAVILDEVHTQPNRELYNVLTTSMGARRQPLVFAITTAGTDRNSLCYQLHEYALKVLSATIEDPTFFAYVRAAPEDADWRSEEVWRAANPAIASGFRKLDDLRMLAREAENIPARENEFRNLYLNQWTSQSVRWLPMHAWDACDEPVDEAALRGRKCYAGLDLASTTDIAALELVFPPVDEGEPYQTVSRFWIPGDNIRDRVRRDRVPYDVWRDKGLVIATEGNQISYADILTELDKLARTFDIEELAFDRWGATMLVQQLQEHGMTVFPFGQGYAQMSAPTKELLNLVISRRLAHGGNPVLRWMADNVAVEKDAAGNVKPSKSKSSEKIDGVVALVMALDRASRATSSTSIYEERGVLVI